VTWCDARFREQQAARNWESWERNRESNMVEEVLGFHAFDLILTPKL